MSKCHQYCEKHTVTRKLSHFSVEVYVIFSSIQNEYFKYLSI